MSSPPFDPLTISTNSKIRMVEVSEGVYLQGKEMEEYCLQRGRCTICAKTKVRRKVVKVFGSNTWEPITAVKVARNNINTNTNTNATDPKQRGFRGKRNKKNTSNSKHNYDTVKAKIESGKDDNDLEYLVYKGYCLREGCYKLNQAKRLVDCSNKSFICSTRSGLPADTRRNSNAKSNSNSSFGSSHKSLVSNSNSNSNTNSIINNNNSNSKKRGKKLFGKGKGLFRRSPKSPASTSTNNNSNPFFTPSKNDKYPLLKIVGEASPIQNGSILSPLSAAGISPSTPNAANLSAPSEKVSSAVTGEVGHLTTQHDKHNSINNNRSNNETKHENDFEKIFETTETAHSSVVPSPQVRRNYKHEFWVDSPKKQNQSTDLYQVVSGDTDEKSKQQQQQKTQTEQPVREIVQETVSALQGLSSNPSSPVINTLDLTGLRFRKSEMEALAKIFRAGKNGTVHLTSLVLDNCGIDDELLWILGQALYDALWTANKSMIGNTKQKVSKSMRHARMRLESLSLGDNDIGNDGIQKGLCPFLESIACELENLDLSRNRIETTGGVTIFNALRRNPQTKIRTIDLSCNLLQELDDHNLDGGEQQKLSPNGQLNGIHGFLSKNRTLKELDLSANRMTDDGVEALCRGLSLAGDKTVLEKLNLGFNRIGDRGAVAFSICLVSNKSLVHLALNDNHIQNDGGESIVSAMEHNTTLKEISGLWSNQIDKRNIIVSIRQLLVSDDRGKTKNSKQNIFGRVPNATGGNTNTNNSNQEADSDSDVDIYITSDSDSTQSKSTRSTIQSRNGTRKKLSFIEEEGANHIEEGKENISDFYSVEDSGNVSDLSDHEEEEDRSESFKRLLRDKTEESDVEAADGMMETNQEVTHNMFDRMTIINSSPLVCFDDKENDARRGIHLYDTKLATEAIKSAVETHQHTSGSRIDVREEMATPDKFKAFFSGHDSSMLHITCHGDEDGLALEDGYGSLEMLSLGSLEELVSGGTARGGDTLGLVFVSSPRARNIGQAFLDAGVKHVVCCQRDDAFRDPLALEFMESFYTHAAQKETLKESFEAALRTVVSSPLSKNLCRVTNRFHLLPLSSPEPSAPIFFQKFVPHHDKDKEEDQEQSWGNGDDVLPLPDHFVGREIEMFKILESLQVADSVEISGSPGCGKECVLAVSLEYALKRKETFSIDHVCWLPAPKYAIVDPDSLYGDLVLCYDLIRDSAEDLWDRSEEVLDCRERLAIELEGVKVVVVIDNRSFTSRGSRASLEKLVNFIVTHTSAAKVVCISSTTATNETEASDYSAIKTNCIEIDALPFRSTVRLFGEISRHVSRSNESALARSAKEFLEVTEVPFVSHTKDPSGVGGSKRRFDIFERMGKGFPTEVIASAKDMSENGFHELMKVVNKPEIRIDSLSELESEVRRWDIFVNLAIENRNFNRSVELQATINELDGMRLQFSSLKDLKAKEKSMKLELANAVSNRRYDVANELKRDLLALKKKIIKERRVSNNAKATLNDLKFQADSLADTIELDESLQEEIKSFDVDCDGHTCTFLIYSGSVFDPKYFTCSSDPNEEEEECKSKCLGIVCWSNEACELEATLDGKALLDFNAERFKDCVADLPVVEETPHGSVRCLMGTSLILNPGSSALVIDTGSDSLEKMVAILTVGPFAGPSGQIDALLERDKDYHRFGITTLRSCYRACVGETNRANLQALVIRPLTTRTKNGPIYEEVLKVAVQTVVEEAKFSTGLREVYLVGKSPKEAMLLAEIMKTMGYSVRVEEAEQPIILTTMASI